VIFSVCLQLCHGLFFSLFFELCCIDGGEGTYMAAVTALLPLLFVLFGMTVTDTFVARGRMHEKQRGTSRRQGVVHFAYESLYINNIDTSIDIAKSKQNR
jgi:hypothetical protein